MTQKDKELLLKDLSARLPYGTICRCRTTEDSTWWNTDHRIFGIIGDKFDVGSDILDAEQIKPYLRPMSSMTEEEKKKVFSCISNGWETTACKEIDLLNANHFDYRGLILMGLALEAPEGMYKTE